MIEGFIIFATIVLSFLGVVGIIHSQTANIEKGEEEKILSDEEPPLITLYEGGVHYGNEELYEAIVQKIELKPVDKLSDSLTLHHQTTLSRFSGDFYQGVSEYHLILTEDHTPPLRLRITFLHRKNMYKVGLILNDDYFHIPPEHSELFAGLTSKKLIPAIARYNLNEGQRKKVAQEDLLKSLVDNIKGGCEDEH